MTMRRSMLTLALVAGAATAGSLSWPIAAHAAQPTNGCPAGYQLLSVATLTSEGYKLPARIDSPTSGLLSFGRPGNGDGLVCGLPLGNRTTDFGGPIYEFVDDTLPTG
jgi:hypothetical protein